MTTSPLDALSETLVRYCAEEQRLLEAQISIMSSLADITNEERRSQWVLVAGGLAQGGEVLPYRSEGELKTIRDQARELVLYNPFAINIIENGKSYIYGTGHNYRIKPRGEQDVPEDLIEQCRNELDAFRREYADPSIPLTTTYIDKWWLRQLETWERRERDGEVFRRLFVIDGRLFIRFVDPELVRAVDGDLDTAFGIRYRRLGKQIDLEQPERYYIYPGPSQYFTRTDVQPDEVPAAEIQHIKVNVDSTAPRGVPTLHAIDPNLRRAARILRNMSTVTEMQSAIAWVRKHISATQETIQRFVSASADVSVTNAGTGKTKTYRDYPPGSVLDTPASVEYQPWATAVDVLKITGALQAELRAAASRVQYPEFMISSDASNANYSSTLVAEAPAAKKFERMQFEMAAYDLDILYKALAVAANAGRLPADVLNRIEIEVEPPSVKTRDVMQETESDIALLGAGVMSKKTLASRHDLDFDKEQPVIQDELRSASELAADLQSLIQPPEGTPPTGEPDTEPIAEGYNPRQRRNPKGSKGGGQFTRNPASVQAARIEDIWGSGVITVGGGTTPAAPKPKAPPRPKPAPKPKAPKPTAPKAPTPKPAPKQPKPEPKPAPKPEPKPPTPAPKPAPKKSAEPQPPAKPSLGVTRAKIVHNAGKDVETRIVREVDKTLDDVSDNYPAIAKRLAQPAPNTRQPLSVNTVRTNDDAYGSYYAYEHKVEIKNTLKGEPSTVIRKVTLHELGHAIDFMGQGGKENPSQVSQENRRLSDRLVGLHERLMARASKLPTDDKAYGYVGETPVPTGMYFYSSYHRRPREMWADAFALVLSARVDRNGRLSYTPVDGRTAWLTKFFPEYIDAVRKQLVEEGLL